MELVDGQLSGVERKLVCVETEICVLGCVVGSSGVGEEEGADVGGEVLVAAD